MLKLFVLSYNELVTPFKNLLMFRLAFIILALFSSILSQNLFAQSPGNVSTSFIQWLKANAGTSTTTDGVGVQTWTDQFGTTQNATQATLANRPLFRDNSSNINFNPYIEFDGVNDRFTIASVNLINQANHNNKSVFIAFRTSSDITTRQLIYRERDQNRGFSFYIDNGNLYCSGWKTSGGGTNWTSFNNAVSIAQNEVIILSFIHDGPNNATGTIDCFKNASNFASVGGVGRFNSANTLSNMGGRNNNSQTRDPITGGVLAAANTDFSTIDYLEHAYYNTTLNTSDRNRVESYLAIKYGVTLDQAVAQNYVRSDATVIYAATTSHNSYRNDIAGIGIDNNSALNQLQSRSVNSDSIVTMSNASALANNEFLVWGNDNDDNGVIQEIYSALPPTANARLDRVWRVDQTGDVGTVTVEFDLNALTVTGTVASDFRLAVKNTNSDFTSGATLLSATSYAGGILTFDNVDFTGDDYFTLITDLVPLPPSVNLSTNLTSINEAGGVATITATLSNIWTSDVIVDLAFSGVAVFGSDYIASGTQIIVPIGDLSASITVTAQNDIFAEGDEGIIIDIDSVTNGTENGVQQVTVTITESGPPNNACDGQERIFTTELVSADVNTYTIAGTYLGTSTSAFPDNFEMVIDPDNEYRYMASYSGQKITRANFDGTGEIVLFDTAPNLPFQITINNNQGKVYWSEWGPSGRIMCANLDGTGTPTAIATGLFYVTGMQIDINTGRLFTYYGLESPVRLDLSTTDGSCSPITFTTLLNTGLNLAYNLTIDPPGNRLFFVDFNGQFIRKINTDGTSLINVWNLTAPGDQMRDIIYNKNNDLLYWVHTNGVIQRANADGTGGITNVVTAPNTFPDSRSIDICVDDAPPRLINFYSTTIDDRYCPGEQIIIRAIYDEAVVGGSTLTVVLNNGASVVLNNIAGNEIWGTYTVGATNSGETIADLSVASISSESVTDSNANTRVNSTVPVAPDNIADTSDIEVDTSPPNIIEVTPVPVVTGNVNPSYTFSSDEVGTFVIGGSCGSVSTVLVVGNNTITLDSDGLGGTLSTTGGPNNDGIYDDCTITATDANGCNVDVYNITPFQVVDVPLVTLSIDNASIGEAGGVATVTATLSNIYFDPVTVNLAFSGTATNISDYTLSNTQIIIPPSSLTGTITITAQEDTLDEDDETVIVDISSVLNGAEDGVQQVTTTIIDNDAPPTVTLSASPLTVNEDGGTSTITATLNTLSGKDVTVNLAYSGTAGFGSDYTVATSIVILAGNLTGSILLTAQDDIPLENDETVIVDIDSVVNGTESGAQQVTITIVDDVTCNDTPWPAPDGFDNYISMSFEETFARPGIFTFPSGDDFDNYLNRTAPQKLVKKTKAYDFFDSEYGLDFSAETPVPGGIIDSSGNVFLRHISFDPDFDANIYAASGYKVHESSGDLRAGIYQAIVVNDPGATFYGVWGGVGGVFVPLGTVVEFGEYELEIPYQCTDNDTEDFVNSDTFLVEFRSEKPSLADLDYFNGTYYIDIPQLFEYTVTNDSPNFVGGTIIGRSEIRQDSTTFDVTATSSIHLTVPTP